MADFSQSSVGSGSVDGRPARLIDAIIFCAIFLGAQFVLGAALGVVILLLDKRIDNVSLALLETASFLILIPVIRKRLKLGLRSIHLYRRVEARTYISLPLISAGFALAIVQIEMSLQRLIPVSGLMKTSFSIFGNPNDLIGALLLACVAAPVVEEILFRGVILRGFLCTYRKATALILSSVLFGVVHLNPWQLVPGMLLGMILGFFYLKTHSLLLCIIIHSLYNGGLLLLNFWSKRVAISSLVEGNQALLGYSALALGIIQVGIGVYILLRTTAARRGQLLPPQAAHSDALVLASAPERSLSTRAESEAL